MIEYGYARQDYLGVDFSRIAIEHYIRIKKDISLLSNCEPKTDESIMLREQIRHHYFIILTFSAMSLEAFFNDYIAIHLGDAHFEKCYDKLTPQGKFQLISDFILEYKQDCGSGVHNLLNGLFKTRNKLVHSKSKPLPETALQSEEEYLRYQKFLNTDAGQAYLSELEIEFDISDEKRLCREAHDAIKAICEVCKLVDHFDNNRYAFLTMISSLQEYPPVDDEDWKNLENEFNFPQYTMD